MSTRRYRPAAQTLCSITAFIRAGAFPHVAAEAAGIPAEVFEAWLARGNPLGRPRGWKPHPTLTPFWREVREAAAQARLTAEVEAHRQEPLRWLISGPGKDRPGAAGWSQMVRSHPAQCGPQGREESILLDPEMQATFARMLEALAPFPEARAAVAQALTGGSATAAIEARPTGHGHP